MTDARQAWIEAFLAAQKEFPTIAKTKTADMGNYQYKFADLGDVLDAALPILHKNGLVLSQPLVSQDGQDGRVGVSTRLYHETGHVEEFGELLLTAGNTPQAAGSALTYARRYAACAALGIVADEDDDGRAVSSRSPEPQPVVEDHGAWLKTAVAAFGKWSEEQKRQAYKAVMEESAIDGISSMAEAKKVFESMAEAYYVEHPPAEESAPF